MSELQKLMNTAFVTGLGLGQTGIGDGQGHAVLEGLIAAVEVSYRRSDLVAFR